MKKQEKEVTKELSCPAPTVDDVKEEENGFIGFLEGEGNGAKKIGKGLLDFLLLDDVNTLADQNASGLDKGIALASFIPIGKVLKIPKAIDKIVDSNVDEVVKKSDVDEVVGKGNALVDTSNFVKNGKIPVDDLKSIIPNDIPNTFKPSETITEGYKYNFEIDGQKIEVKWHSPDLNAKQLYPDSNSGNMWTAQIKIGKKLLGQDGNLYKKPNNLTHIPIE
ncbi:hypothetical protein [Solibacillus ferritrahens]|uniref:Pre-toxin TG domain-containing protein n=2 Tax=Solibacillus merdavium TaxID=2762218 RepID=A0ABR8XJT0_9BACL|nr:hypothetical protein [Solibacillus merdavium]